MSDRTHRVAVVIAALPLALAGSCGLLHADDLDPLRSPLFALAAFEAYQETCPRKFDASLHDILHHIAAKQGVDARRADHRSVTDGYRTQIVSLLHEGDVTSNCGSLSGKLHDMFSHHLADR